MAIEVRCGCGQLVYAEERFAGQHVQCPHCKAAVAVPVAQAAAAAPPPATSPAGKETPAEGAMMAAGGVAGFLALWACSDYLAPGLVKMLGFGALMAVIGGLVVMFGGRRSDLFR